MTERSGALDPAIGIVELDSIAVGVMVGDAMVKAAPVGSISTGTVQPGRYLILVSGDTASVDVALETGLAAGGSAVVDTIFLPNIHPDVAAAIVSDVDAASADGDAIGVIETRTVATVIEAADAGVKAANVVLSAVRLADGLGGKGYLVFTGVVAEVEFAVEAATARAGPTGNLLAQVVIPQLHDEMRHNLRSELRFNRRLAARPRERSG